MKKSFVTIGATVASASVLAMGFAVSNAFGKSPSAVHIKNQPSSGIAAVGSAAPEWTLPDTKGTTHDLKDFLGKIVVMEWTNDQCPYVQKHYRTGNMQSLQKFAAANRIVWLTVVSSAKGREGFVTPEEGQKISADQHSLAAAKLLDQDGTVGHEYGAKTTPDMMIIDKTGTLVYSGGIDDQPTTDDSDIKTAHNYVRAALNELLAGKPVSVSTSQPYGCAIKYGAH